MSGEIIVQGTAELRVMPELARIRVDVDGEGASRKDAYAQTQSLAAAVDAVLDAHADGIEARTGSALVVQPKTRWRKGESQRTGWRAARGTTVLVHDLERLGTLLAELATAGAAVAGPSWELEPSHEAHGRARAAAARDARARAEDYAEGLGLAIGAVAWVAEPGLRHGEGIEEILPMAGGATRGAGGIAEEPIEVAPAELPVRASVEVGFSFGPAA